MPERNLNGRAFENCIFLFVKQVLQKDVTSSKNELIKLGRDLDHVEQSCSPLRQGFNEHCPDLFRQEADVKRLRNRYTSVNNQLQER